MGSSTFAQKLYEVAEDTATGLRAVLDHKTPKDPLCKMQGG